jgi:hypothetical protein
MIGPASYKIHRAAVNKTLRPDPCPWGREATESALGGVIDKQAGNC